MKPYSILLPPHNNNGILFNSPHSGRFMPADFLNQVTIDPAHLHYSADMFIDDLIKDVPAAGATAILHHYARTYVDSNRSLQDIDGDMFTAPQEEQNVTKTEKTLRGFGIFSRKMYNGKYIYADKLPFAEIEHRLNLVYRPVHKTITAMLEKFYHQHGYYILFDCHSMPSYKFIDQNLSNLNQADLIIGNCFDKSCGKDVTDYVANYFTKAGLKVTFNTPYAGGYNTQCYGQYDKETKNEKHALQLEFNRALYMNEHALTPNENFPELQVSITQFSQKLNEDLDSLFSTKKRL